MVYEVPRSKASIKQNQFEFRIPDSDKVYTLPLMKFLPVGVVAKIQVMDTPTIFDILELFGNGAPAAAVALLDAEQIEALTDAWQGASGISMGES